MPGSNHTVAVSRPLPSSQTSRPRQRELTTLELLAKLAVEHAGGIYAGIQPGFTAWLQLPPPPQSSEYPPTAVEQFFMLFVTLALIFTLVLLMLPEKFRRKVIKIAFYIGRLAR